MQMVKNLYGSNHKLDGFIAHFAKWHHDRNLIAGSSDQAQFVKLAEELGELASNIARGRDFRDDVGDMLVILTNLVERHGWTLQGCAEKAWNDIKDRKGMMKNGVFVKEGESE